MTTRSTAILACASILLLGARGLAQGTPPPSGTPSSTRPSELDELRARLDELERRCGSKPPRNASGEIDLTEHEVPPKSTASDANPLGRPWYENLDVWGFGAFTYLDTGSVGQHPDGGFLVQEASIYAEAHAWDRIVLHAELQAASVGFDFVGTGELYADWKNLWGADPASSATLRAGRFWVPFGEETFRFHAPENPLISYSAAFPWGLDEGVELYGSVHGLDWAASVTSGSAARDSEDGPAKTFNLKLSGKPLSNLELGGSLMRQGATSASSLDFGGTEMSPVGSNGSSSAGASPSSAIEATLGELDARVLWPSRGSVGFTFGRAEIDDPVNAFDRSFDWLSVEPRYDITPSLYAVLRYSEIGTYDSSEGYHFDGLMIADANTAFGYDVRRFQRMAAGLGWKANPHTLLKCEVGHDRFWLVDGSTASAEAGDRTYFGVGLVVSF